MIASSPCSSRRPTAVSRCVCTTPQARCRCCKLRRSFEPTRLPSTIPPRAKPPWFSPNAKQTPLAARQSAASLRPAQKAAPMLALRCTPPAEVLPTAPQSSAKGSSSTRRRRTTTVHEQKSLRTLQPTRRSVRTAAPFPSTSTAVTGFPAACAVPQPAMRTFCRAELAHFFSQLFV